jgi:hypothetical protein
MGQEYVISSDGWRKIGHELEVPRNTVSDAYKGLLIDLDHAGEAWGHDDYGSAFSAGYVPSRDKLFVTLDDVLGGLDSLINTCFKTAKEYDETNQNTAS